MRMPSTGMVTVLILLCDALDSTVSAVRKKLGAKQRFAGRLLSIFSKNLMPSGVDKRFLNVNADTLLSGFMCMTWQRLQIVDNTWYEVRSSLLPNPSLVVVHVRCLRSGINNNPIKKKRES